MIAIQEGSEQNQMGKICPKCNGTGKTFVFRGDWDDYDEISCDHDL